MIKHPAYINILRNQVVDNVEVEMLQNLPLYIYEYYLAVLATTCFRTLLSTSSSLHAIILYPDIPSFCFQPACNGVAEYSVQMRS